MLLERDQELGVLGRALSNAESSGGKVVLIRGEAGIGKSSLVRAFIDSHSETAHVHFGSCDDLLTPRALGPFWDLARQQPSVAEPLQRGDRTGVLEAILGLLSGSLRPSILVIEDTQWADEATLDAIKYLGRRIPRTISLILLTYRDAEVDQDHPLRSVIGDLPPQSVVRIQLAGLSLEAVSSIVGASDLDPRQVLATTRGNPFFVTELAATSGEKVPTSVHDSVMARMQRMSIQAQEALRTLSVTPGRVPRTEVLELIGGDDGPLAEGEQLGMLDVGPDFVTFHHELIRRTVEASLTEGRRLATNRRVLNALPDDADPARLVHHARQAGDIERVVELAPRAARAAAVVGSHREAVAHFRLLEDHLDHLIPESRGPILDEWAREEFLIDNLARAIELNELALAHHHDTGDRTAESGALAQGAHLHENDGQRTKAEQLARQAVEVLGPDPDQPSLARALEVGAYLQMMAGNTSAAVELVEQTLAAAGPEVDERIIIRTLNHRGIVANITNYPAGRASMDAAADRAQAAEQWYEESRALFNHAWAAAEHRDLAIAADYAQRAIASGARHELTLLESYAMAMFARILDFQGEWSRAEDVAVDQLERSALSQMVALPILGVLQARTGRDQARIALKQAWDMCYRAGEFQRLGPVGMAMLEYAWITNDQDIPLNEIREVMVHGLDLGFTWSPGAIAFWLWKLGVLTEAPDGIAEPYRLVIEGDPAKAAGMWAKLGCPYDRAIALTHGDISERLEAHELLQELGATAVAAKLRKDLRDAGISVPRGKGNTTRAHPAGLTARQDEVLQLLAEELSNAGIADRLFVSPRTVEHHVAAVLLKLGASTREEAVSAASASGLL